MLSRLEIAMSNKTLVDQWVERDEALRELLSYCRANECADDPGYGDVANRLEKILDGER